MNYVQVLIALIPLIFALFATKRYNFIHGIITFFATICLFVFIEFLHSEFPKVVKLPQSYFDAVTYISLLEVYFSQLIDTLGLREIIIGKADFVFYGKIFGVFIVSWILSSILRRIVNHFKNKKVEELRREIRELKSYNNNDDRRSYR